MGEHLGVARHGAPAQMAPPPARTLTELGPTQKFSCWMYFTLSYTPLFLSTCCRSVGELSEEQEPWAWQEG